MLLIAALLVAVYLLLIALVYVCQRSLLYFPAHAAPSTTLVPWTDGTQTIGWRREVPNARAVWLMMHGNAGQAADRDYVLNRMSDRDSLYVLEYPGYGRREGRPCLETINLAAAQAYRLLRSQNKDRPVCVLGESIGSGPACALAREKAPPDKIVLVTPFDTLANIASKHFRFFPVRFLLRDAWDNVEALRNYAGPVDIFAATADTVIPIAHAKALASQVRGARLIPIPGGHNDWSRAEQVRIAR